MLKFLKDSSISPTFHCCNALGLDYDGRIKEKVEHSSRVRGDRRCVHDVPIKSSGSGQGRSSWATDVLPYGSRSRELLRRIADQEVHRTDR